MDHGSGNLHSVSRAIAKVGGDAEVTGDPAAVTGADALVIPGVGHFGACVRAINGLGLGAAVRAFVASGRPVFGVCVGMQVLFERSDEDPEPGLGVIPGDVRALPATEKVPHMGWNTVDWTAPHAYTAGIPSGTRFYFVHSFAPDVIEGTTVGVTEHGRRFSAVVAGGNVFAAQFHPEKSSEAGLQIYENFVKAIA